MSSLLMEMFQLDLEAWEVHFYYFLLSKVIYLERTYCRFCLSKRDSI